MNALKKTTITFFSGLMLFTLSFESFSQVVVAVKPSAPAVKVVKPSKRKAGHIWVDGHWTWNKKRGKYIWVEGRWVRQRKGHSWITGHWKQTRGGWIWVEGRWRVV